MRGIKPLRSLDYISTLAQCKRSGSPPNRTGKSSAKNDFENQNHSLTDLKVIYGVLLSKISKYLPKTFVIPDEVKRRSEISM